MLNFQINFLYLKLGLRVEGLNKKQIFSILKELVVNLISFKIIFLNIVLIKFAYNLSVGIFISIAKSNSINKVVRILSKDVNFWSKKLIHYSC